MLVKFGDFYIDNRKIESITTEDNLDLETPYRTVVRTANQIYSMQFRTKEWRERFNLDFARNCNAEDAQACTRYEVEQIVSDEVEKLRRDFRRTRQIALMEGIKNAEN